MYVRSFKKTRDLYQPRGYNFYYNCDQMYSNFTVKILLYNNKNNNFIDPNKNSFEYCSKFGASLFGEKQKNKTK